MVVKRANALVGAPAGGGSDERLVGGAVERAGEGATDAQADLVGRGEA